MVTIYSKEHFSYRVPQPGGSLVLNIAKRAPFFSPSPQNAHASTSWISGSSFTAPDRPARFVPDAAGRLSRDLLRRGRRPHMAIGTVMVDWLRL
ncbi:hypothetical protein ACG7TL_005153 [Trametes sanguinea]